jgi:hypothetical protein
MKEVLGFRRSSFVQSRDVLKKALIGTFAEPPRIGHAAMNTRLLMSCVGETNTVAVFVSRMFCGWALLLAVPITSAIKAVCERMDGLDVFAERLRA